MFADTVAPRCRLMSYATTRSPCYPFPITFNFISQKSHTNSIVCRTSMLHIPKQHLASHLTMGRLHLWPVCPGSFRGLSAISRWLFRRGRLSAHLLPSSAPLPVIIEADTVPLWLPSYIPPTTTSPHLPLSPSHLTSLCLPLCALSLPKSLLPGPG